MWYNRQKGVILMNKDDIKYILFSEKEIAETVSRLAARINADYGGEEIIVGVVLKGSLTFAADLIRKLDMPIRLDFIQASSYGSGSKSTGQVKIKKDLENDIGGKHLLLIEDIIDSGNTLAGLKKMLKDRGPASVKICALLSKPSRREVEIEAEYIGAEIPDEFVVGYGLDYDEKYRNLPYIGVLKPRVYGGKE